PYVNAVSSGVFIGFINGTANYILRSLDGIVWTTHTIPISISTRQIAWSPELQIFTVVSLLSGTDQVIYSIDSINWFQGSYGGNDWAQVSVLWCSGFGMFISGSSGSDRLIYSYNGINWVSTTFPISSSWLC